MASIFSLSRTKDEPSLTQVFSFLLNSERKQRGRVLILEQLGEQARHKNGGQGYKYLPQSRSLTGGQATPFHQLK